MLFDRVFDRCRRGGDLRRVRPVAQQLKLGAARNLVGRAILPSVGRGRGRGGEIRFFLLQDKGLKFLGRNGLGEEIALHEVAAERLEHMQLLLRLDALGNHGNGQMIRDPDDHLDDMGVPAGLEGLADKLHIQLQRVDREPGDHVQRGIPGPEVVHLDLKAVLAQRFHRRDDLGGILSIGGFRDLQQKVAPGETMLADDLLKRCGQVRVVHIDPGYIDGDRDRIAETVLPVAHLPRGLAPDIGVEPLDQTVLFKQRDEHAGADHPKLRVDPAHKRLRAREDGGIRPHVEFGLVINLELLLADRLRKVLDELFGIELALVQAVVIDANRARIGVLRRVGGHFGTVDAALHVDRLVGAGIDAHAQTHAALRGVLVRETGGGALQQRLIVVAVRAVGHKGIGLETRDDAAVRADRFAQQLGDAAQHLVAVGLSVAFVDHAEMVDIDDHGVGLDLRVELVILFGIAEEILPVIKPCQRVALGGLDDVAVLKQLDRAQHAGVDHIDVGIGLGDKVYRAEAQALHLRVLF